MPSTSRNIGGVGQVNEVKQAGPTTMSKSEVKALSTGFKSAAEDLVAKYQGAKTDDAKTKIMSEQTLGATMDKFVADVRAGKIELPKGMDPASVVAPGIKPLLEQGFTYSIDTPGWNGTDMGSSHYSFSLDKPQLGGTQDHASGVWVSESTAR
jgi:hypothetical protein